MEAISHRAEDLGHTVSVCIVFPVLFDPPDVLLSQIRVEYCNDDYSGCSGGNPYVSYSRRRYW